MGGKRMRRGKWIYLFLFFNISWGLNDVAGFSFWLIRGGWRGTSSGREILMEAFFCLLIFIFRKLQEYVRTYVPRVR